MIFFNVWKNNSLHSTILYISRIVYIIILFCVVYVVITSAPVYVPYPMMKMKNMCKKKWIRAIIPGAGSIIYFLWTAIVRKNYAAGMLILKIVVYVAVKKSLFLSFDCLLKNSVKSINAMRWKIQWNISLFLNEWFRTLFLCGPEQIFIS
jgi:hypothetical protein